MLTYLLGPILSLLPERWRTRLFGTWNIHWPQAVAVSGLLEGFGCLVGLAMWYLIFIEAATEEQAAVAAQALATRSVPQGLTNIEVGYGIGAGGLLAFALHPLSWTLAYFGAEGIYRAMAAWVYGDAPGTGPLGLVDRLARWGHRRAYEQKVPLVPDKVTVDLRGKEWNLKVESCRPKPLWKYPKVVKYKDSFYQVVGESTGGATPVRPHVYLLRAAVAGEAYRGMEPYDPHDVLQPGEPTLLQATVRALRDGFRAKTLPLVADEVHRVVDANGVFLNIESCRLKEEWSVGRLIRYEGCLYRVEQTYEAEPPRPFGFQLRLLPAGISGRRVIDYSPEDVLRKK